MHGENDAFAINSIHCCTSFVWTQSCKRSFDNSDTLGGWEG